MATTTPPSLPPNYTLHIGYPSVPEYLHLRSTSGLSAKTAAQATAALQGSWHGCYITYTDIEATLAPGGKQMEVEVVAMGRIIGDGGWYFHIADMAVLPTHQRRGLGDVVLKSLLAHIEREAAEGKPYVNLLADEPGRRLYRKNGFVDSAPESIGMVWMG